MIRRLLFHRDFREYTGGHGKVWDYFNHANAHPGWRASVFLTPPSTARHNPWQAASAAVDATWDPAVASALFLGGLDWTAYPADHMTRPVINLVQHLRHADPGNALYRHLPRRAIRICVSQAVADAIQATGLVNGPVRVIPAGLDLSSLPVAVGGRHGVFIGAIKNPVLGHALRDRLSARGEEVTLVASFVPRDDYLAGLARCRVAVLLPSPTEGFYLPALEAMALGCATVVPDCIGNQQYLRPGSNALAPEYGLDALFDAIVRLDDRAYAKSLALAGTATAAAFDLDSERATFHGVLDRLDALWAA